VNIALHNLFSKLGLLDGEVLYLHHTEPFLGLEKMVMDLNNY
jgi:hypothetical protein